jgi:GABA permease
MSYVSPDKVFAFLVNSYGTVAIFVYVLIAVSQLRLRRRLELESPDRLKMRMWGFPHLTRLTIVAMLAIVAAMGFIPDQRAPLVFGLVSVLVLLAAYALRRAAGSPADGPAA